MLFFKLITWGLLFLFMGFVGLIHANPNLSLRPSKTIVLERQDIKITPEAIVTHYVFKNHFVLDVYETLTFDLDDGSTVELFIEGRPFAPEVHARATQRMAYWVQKFPATKTVHIKHVQSLVSPKKPLSALSDVSVCQSLDGQVNGFAEEIPVMHYVFGEATPWATAVQKFSLQVEAKGTRKPIVCWDHPMEQRTPTLMMFTAENFIPEKGIDVFYR